MIERRRAPRHEVAADGLAVLPSAVSVQVLDISLDGALLQSSHPVGVGSGGRLTLSLQGRRFSTQIEVCRVEQVAGDRPLYNLGVRFAGLGPEHHRAIEVFTWQGSA